MFWIVGLLVFWQIFYAMPVVEGLTLAKYFVNVTDAEWLELISRRKVMMSV